MIPPKPKSILVVDDEPSICWGFERMLSSEGHRVQAASSSEEGLQMAGQGVFDLVLLDVRLPGEDGISALPKFRAETNNAPVVVMTAFGDLETAVEAVRQGASDYLTKPFELEDALRICRTALQTPVVDSNPSPFQRSSRSMRLVGSSPSMQKLYRQIAVIADSDLSVLILGETGTGKELAARALVNHSQRADSAYLAVAPVALSEALIESELFGHVRGAFTGATYDRPGIFELADGGTVLLDEIGDLSESVQVKLLRILEHGEYTRVGEARPRQCDVRILAATNRDLSQMVRDGQFREDLYYRLSAAQVLLPPLRERLEDLPDLVECFLQQMGHPEPKSVTSDSFLSALRKRSWQGNVRELRNAVEHACVVARGRTLTSAQLPSAAPIQDHHETSRQTPEQAVHDWTRTKLATAHGSDEPSSQDLGGTLHDDFLTAFEPALLKAVLQATEGNRAAAAERLGIHRGTLRDRLRKYGID